MEEYPYCGAPGDFCFEISLKIYNRCSECDLIYKKNYDSYDKVVAFYCNDYYRKHSVDQMWTSRGQKTIILNGPVFG